MVILRILALLLYHVQKSLKLGKKLASLLQEQQHVVDHTWSLFNHRISIYKEKKMPQWFIFIPYIHISLNASLHYLFARVLWFVMFICRRIHENRHITPPFTSYTNVLWQKIYERARRHTHTPTRTVGKTPTRLILNEPAHGYSVVSSILTPKSSNYSNNSIKITSAFWAEYELHTDTNPRALRRKTEPGGRYPCPIYMISNIDKDVLDWAPERTAITEMLQITYYEFHIIGEEKKEGQRREN